MKPAVPVTRSSHSRGQWRRTADGTVVARPTDIDVGEAVRARRRRVRIDVAQIDENRRRSSAAFSRSKSSARNCVPFGDDDERVGAVGGVVGIAAEGDALDASRAPAAMPSGS